MAVPNINDAASGVPQQLYDGEAVVLTATDWVPTRPLANAPQVARAILCTAPGTILIDCMGLAGIGSGSTSLPVPMTAGQQLQIAFTKVHKVGTSGTYMAFY
jgi:hypothetical protein